MSYSLEQTKEAQGLKFCHMNAETLLNKLYLVKFALHHFDFVTISETALNQLCDASLLNWPGKVYYRMDRNYNKSGGLIVYVRECLKDFVTVIDEHCSINTNIEILTLDVSIPNNRALRLITVYRPHSGKPQIFCDLLNNALHSKKENWVLGDINANFKDGSDLRAIPIKEMCRNVNLTWLVTDITRPNKSNTRGTTIDNILTDCKYVSLHGVIDVLISDHHPVFAIRKKKSVINEYITIYGRDYSNFNLNAFIVYLNTHDWSPLYNAVTTDEKVDFYLSVVNSYLDCHHPYVKKKVKNPNTPWMDDSLQTLMDTRDQYCKNYKRYGKICDYEKAKQFRIKVTRQTRLSKAQHVQSQLKIAGKNTWKFWQRLHKYLKPPKNATAPKFTDINGKPVQHIADFINDYFTNICNNLCKAHNLTMPTLTAPNPSSNITLKDDEKIDIIDLASVVQEVNIHKPSGLPKISTGILKDYMLNTLPEFLHICNHSLETSTFPSIFKKATITPIPKTGDLSQIKNWRPISILPIPGKIMEKLVYQKLMKIIEQNHLLQDYQYGFRKDRSTGDAIFDFTNDVLKAHDSDQFVACTFYDATKAFDCVNHAVLISILREYKLPEIYIEWIHSYLYNRKQRVITRKNTYYDTTETNENGTETHVTNFEESILVSQLLTVADGVPQGSQIGPPLYIIYSSKIGRKTKYCTIKLFADDLLMYSIHKNPKIALSHLQIDMSQLDVDFDDIGQITNIEKSKFMWIHSKRVLHLAISDVPKIKGQTIQEVQVFTYLGAKFDRFLTFEPFLKDMIKKANFAGFKLAKIRYLINAETSIQIYKQNIRPHFDYCSFLVDSGPSNFREKLQLIQNRLLRICLKAKIDDISISNLHKICEVPLLDSRRTELLASLFYTKSKKMSFTNPHKFSTRSSSKRTFPRYDFKRKTFKNSPYFRGMILWNNLPKSTQFANTKYDFKLLIKKKLGTNLKGLRRKVLTKILKTNKLARKSAPFVKVLNKLHKQGVG